MSISIQGRTGWATIPNTIGRSRLPYPTLTLLVNLLTHSEGFSASYSLIADQTGMSPTTISSAIENLKKLGLISVKKVASKHGQFASNHYDFHVDLLWKLSPDLVEERLNAKTATTANGAGTATANGVAPLQQMECKNEHLETPLKNDQPIDESNDSSSEVPPKQIRQTYPPEFDDWWKAYPKRTGSKKKAYEQFKKAIKRSSLEELHAGTDRLSAFLEKEGKSPKFIKDAERWLKDDMWEEELVSYAETSMPAKSTNTVDAWLGTAATSSHPEIGLSEENPFGTFIDHEEFP